MKKRILIFFLIIALLCLTILFAKPVMAANSVVAKIGTTEYNNLNSALEAAKSGDEVILQKNITIEGETSSQEGKGYIDVPNTNNITLNLNGKTIVSKNSKSDGALVVKRGAKLTITGNGKIEAYGTCAVYVKKGNVTIKNGTYSNYEIKNQTECTLLGIGDAEGDAKITIENAKILSANGARGVGVAGTGSEFIIYNCTINASETGETQISGRNYKNEGLIISGTNCKGTLYKGTINCGSDGVFLGGTNAQFTMYGGTINAQSFGISGNNTIKESKFTMNNGTITSTKASGIYWPQTGNVNINKGNISGQIGILSRRGNLTISGGTIEGTGNGEDIQLGTDRVDLKSGVGILVDNVTTGYGAVEGDSKDEIGRSLSIVHIKGGNIQSNGGADAIQSFNGKDDITKDTDDFDIIAGRFDTAFNSEYIENGKVELTLKSKGDTDWYVGNDAQKALKNANNGDEVEILQGDIEVSGVAGGVTIKNSGEGIVKINEITIKDGEEITIESPDVLEESKISEKETEEKDDTPKTGVMDATILDTVMSTVALTGIAVIKKYNK